MQSGAARGGDRPVQRHPPAGGQPELRLRPPRGVHQHSQAGGEAAVQQDTKVYSLVTTLLILTGFN